MRDTPQSTDTTENEKDPFQELSYEQLRYFTKEGKVDKNSLKLNPTEKELLLNFFSYKVYESQLQNPALTTMNFVRGEILTGNYWLMLTEAERKDYLLRIVGYTEASIEKHYPDYESLFRKIHASAWEGRLKQCVGEEIYSGAMQEI